MIIGIDVLHMVGRNKLSLVGFTATMDWYMSKYFVSSASKPLSKKKKIQDVTFSLEPLF